jgi:hypothetical protein
MKTWIVKIWAWLKSWFVKVEAEVAPSPAGNDNAPAMAASTPWYLTAWEYLVWGCSKFVEAFWLIAKAKTTIRIAVVTVIVTGLIGGYVGGYMAATHKWKPRLEVATSAWQDAERDLKQTSDDLKVAVSRYTTAEQKLFKLEHPDAPAAAAVVPAPKPVTRRKSVQAAPAPAKLWGIF